MPVARYMGESNARYYANRDPLGAEGDFTTAPEISQMFGELIGLWIADLWSRSGRPEAAYVELGPGRGTLARDALRAMAAHGLRPEVHLVEGSPALRTLQSSALGEARFHDGLDTLPEDRPLFIVGNEFLDALPIRELVMTDTGWRERMVGLDGEQLVFIAGPNPMDDAIPEDRRVQPVGTVIETCPGAAAMVAEIARRIDAQGGAALLIDYGYGEPRTGETMQAVRRHEKTGIFDAPGDMDITALVDFAALREVAMRGGATVQFATQGSWLEAMGIGMRARSLAEHSPQHAESLAAACSRLTSPDAMGNLFKVMALTPSQGPRGAGFG